MTQALQAALAARLARIPARTIVAGDHRLAVREAGSGVPMLLLHGIGSGSGSWLYLLEQPPVGARLIAWDQPGYGDSAPLAGEPDANRYASAALALADALGLDRFVLVGQSLGAIIATTLAARAPERLKALTLLAPARGYGAAPAAERDAKLADRLTAFESMGADAYAAARAGNLLKPDPAPEALALVQLTMAQLKPVGHRHAAQLLVSSDIAAAAARYAAPVIVASGSADRVTPEAGCRAIAQSFPQGEYRSLGAVGHASFIDAPLAVNALLKEVLHHAAH